MIERTMQSDRIRYIGKGRGRRRPSGRTHRDTTLDVPARTRRDSHRSGRRSPESGRFALYDQRALGVRRALDRLPDPVDRQIVVLRFFVGLSLAEIAECLRRPVGEVRGRYRVAVQRLERALRPFLT